MLKKNINDLLVFTVVAQERSFTKAAVKLRTSQSAISQTLRNLEKRLGITLLSRTTRSVTPTQAGEYLLKIINPALENIENGIAQINGLKSKPAGMLRINADEYAIKQILLPVIEQISSIYPDILFEISSDYGLTDIVENRYDAGLRRGGLLSKDMIATPVSKPITMALVGGKDYLRKFGIPKKPKDLICHDCIHLRLPTHGELFHWKFIKDDQMQCIKVNSKIIFSSISPILSAVQSNIGLAYLPLDMVKKSIEDGLLQEVLVDWRYTFEPYYLYYPHRKGQSPLLNILIETLKNSMLNKL